MKRAADREVNMTVDGAILFGISLLGLSFATCVLGFNVLIGRQVVFD